MSSVFNGGMLLFGDVGEVGVEKASDGSLSDGLVGLWFFGGAVGVWNWTDWLVYGGTCSLCC